MTLEEEFENTVCNLEIKIIKEETRQLLKKEAYKNKEVFSEVENSLIIKKEYKDSGIEIKTDKANISLLIDQTSSKKISGKTQYNFSDNEFIVFFYDFDEDFFINSFHYATNKNFLIVDNIEADNCSILVLDKDNNKLNKRYNKKALKEFINIIFEAELEKIEEKLDIINLKYDINIKEDVDLIEIIENLRSRFCIKKNRNIKKNTI